MIIQRIPQVLSLGAWLGGKEKNSRKRKKKKLKTINYNCISSGMSHAFTEGYLS